MNISTDAPAGAAAARLAIVCFAAFALGIALMHVLRPDYAPASHMISDYAVGPWGGVMTAAFGSASAGCLLLAICMAQSGPRSVWAWLITLLHRRCDRSARDGDLPYRYTGRAIDAIGRHP